MTIWHIMGDGSLVDARTIPNLDEPSKDQQLSF
jgi:hypothetical protein